MVWKFLGGIAIVVASCPLASAQPNGDWSSSGAASAPPPRRFDVTPIGVQDGGFASELGTLAKDAGQVWREYDIRSFTDRLRGQSKPEQAIVDWIVRETGTNTWFGETMSVLNASRTAVRVYHTPEVQSVVQEVIDRFVNSRSEANEVAVRLVTVESPDWRVKARAMLKPVKSQTPGIEAWMLSREDASLLLDELARRADFREHNSPNLTIYSGQSQVIKSTRPRTFAADVSANSQATGRAEPSQLEEGFSLQISPLVSLEGDAMEAVIKCSVNQIERFTALWVSQIDQFGMLRRSQVQVPQLSSWQLHERFRWPSNEVLLISRGLVATPGPTASRGALRRILDAGAPRADALLFLESRSEVRSVERSATMASRTDAANYRGRY